MPSYSDARLDRLELALRLMEERALRAEAKLAQLDQRQRMQAAGVAFAAPGGGGAVYVGQAVTSILADDTGAAQPYSTAGGGWVASGAAVAVRNLDPAAAIGAGKRIVWQADQSGTLVASPLQC